MNHATPHRLNFQRPESSRTSQQVWRNVLPTFNAQLPQHATGRIAYQACFSHRHAAAKNMQIEVHAAQLHQNPIQDAIADLDLAHGIRPLTDYDQQLRKHSLKLLARMMLARNSAQIQHMA